MQTPEKPNLPNRSDYAKASPSSEARKMTEDEKKSFNEKLKTAFLSNQKYF